MKFNQYPATKPGDFRNYLVLFEDGTTDSYWYAPEEDSWGRNEWDEVPAEGVIGWAEFPHESESCPCYYILFIWNDIEPVLHGPYQTEKERDEKALELGREHGDSLGYFMLDSAGPVDISPYGAGFFHLIQDKT